MAMASEREGAGETGTPGTTAAALLDGLERARHERRPFDHWLLADVLPAGTCEAIEALPFPAPVAGEAGVRFDGRRETNNATRVYFTPEQQRRFPVCRAVAGAFEDPAVRAALAATTGAELEGGLLRIEYCQDAAGFWLEPHTDIAVKRLTLLIYLSDDPGLAMAGTDLHEGPPDFRYVGSAPYGRNKGLIFVPGDDTWHGVGHHPIHGVRRSIIVNYVGPEWRDRWELA
jgi:hypothetical protein